MTCSEAIKKFVHDGDTIAVGGFTTNRKPYALINEIVRQNKKDLYIEGGGAGGETDLLIGAGCARLIVNAYIANGAFGKIGRRFRAAVERNEIEFEDYSLDVQGLRFHAAALGLPYIPVRHLFLGSDLDARWGIASSRYSEDPKLPPAKLLKMENPFNPNEKIVCFPVPKIDVAIIHVQKMASDGTVRIEGPLFYDMDMVLAARRVIVSCEELVKPEELRREPWLNQVPSIVPDAGVHLPFGAHPSQCVNFYDYDPELINLYEHSSRDDNLYVEFVNDHIFSCRNHDEYLEKIGFERLNKLRVGTKNYLENLQRKSVDS